MSRHAVFIELVPNAESYVIGATKGESLEKALTDLIGSSRYQADKAVDWLSVNVAKIRMPPTR